MATSLALILIVYVGILFGLLSLGMWFGVTVGVVGVVSFAFLVRGANIHLFVLVVYNQLRSFTLTAVPLFIFLGEILLHTGIGTRLYKGLMGIMQGIPGGLLHVNIWSCALLAAASGSSPATVATMASVAVPELERLGYNRRWALGTLTVAGSLGLMIPPSVALILYGFMTETSVVRLFTAGIVPGILLAGLFSGVILLQGLRNPADLGGTRIQISRLQVIKDFAGIVPMFFLIAIVLGSIYAGVATPTEAAALGCLGAIAVAGSYRLLTVSGLYNATRETIIVMGTIGFIIIGALAMSYSVSHLGLGSMLVRWINTLQIPPMAVLFLLYFVYIVLGCVMESLALLLIMVPIAFPIVVGLGYDPVWFGIVVVVGQELACITPPIGVNLWVMQGITGEPMERLAWAVLPFFVVLVLFLVVLTFFPQIATWLPDLIFG